MFTINTFRSLIFLVAVGIPFVSIAASAADKKMQHGAHGRGDDTSSHATGHSNTAALEAQSNGGSFHVSLLSRSQPVPVAQFHEWTVTLRGSDGAPIENAQVSVDGGMPAHGHGMPSQPVVSRYLGDGAYLVEGMKFNMHGSWELVVRVAAGPGRPHADEARVPLRVQP